MLYRQANSVCTTMAIHIICFLVVFLIQPEMTKVVANNVNGQHFGEPTRGQMGLSIYSSELPVAETMSLMLSDAYGAEEVGKPRRPRPPKDSSDSATSNNNSNRTSVRKTKVRRIVHPSIHAAWDEYNNLCILAKFQVTFTIKYETFAGTAQLIDKMPPNSRSKGRCDQFEEEPILDVLWKDTQLAGGQRHNSTTGFTFRLIFQRHSEENQWGVQQMQLLYNTGHPVFRGATNPRKFIVKSDKDDYSLQFLTKLGESMLCPSPPPIKMFDSDGEERVIARLSNMQLQAFEFSDSREGSNFDHMMRCEQVSFGSGVVHPLTRSDSVTFGIGIMTVCTAALTVVGYALFRSHVLTSTSYKNVI